MARSNHPEPFVAQEPTILIFIGRSLGDDLSKVGPNDVYAATRGWWRGAIEPKEANGELILARTSTHIVGVFRARQWLPSPFGEARWGFSGEPAELSAQLAYFGKGIPPENRVQNPVQYLLWPRR